VSIHKRVLIAMGVQLLLFPFAAEMLIVWFVIEAMFSFSED
jgi:hypothetical protein